MSCLEVMRKLTDYLQGDLKTDEAATVERHIARCRQCRLVVRSASEVLHTYFAADEETRTIESHAA